MRITAVTPPTSAADAPAIPASHPEQIERASERAVGNRTNAADTKRHLTKRDSFTVTSNADQRNSKPTGNRNPHGLSRVPNISSVTSGLTPPLVCIYHSSTLTPSRVGSPLPRQSIFPQEKTGGCPTSPDFGRSGNRAGWPSRCMTKEMGAHPFALFVKGWEKSRSAF